ncbi:hypothetical protein EYB45_02835 [Erythrobacteraceae bacterium CFH 75059]|uniref:hypothetical protein n=1 Tax=Qipengyuania thermophila TaxID=2509361 RepID=UPI00102206A1|nr:hypothetical protein [Qipengyuania thermophila]TCD06655.1 hypothetical protein EYB45_02835 [Erythrobacteraceae bacterium CFH 75059]
MLTEESGTMIDLFDEQARQHFAARRAALDAAQRKAAAFARAELDAASARLSALADGQVRLGPQPTPEAYASAEEWSTARDQHTFAASRYARDIAEAEQRVNALREEHTRLLAEVEPLREALWRAVLSALHAAAEAQTREAARIATLHKSLLARLPQEHWHWAQTAGQPIFRVEGAGFHDISKFVATVVGDGFGPDKSAALVAELGL